MILVELAEGGGAEVTGVVGISLTPDPSPRRRRGTRTNSSPASTTALTTALSESTRRSEDRSPPSTAGVAGTVTGGGTGGAPAPGAPPLHGQHTKDVLRELGYSEGDIARIAG